MADESASPSGQQADKPAETAARTTWWKRGSTKVIAALAAGALAGVGALAQQGVISIGHTLVASDVVTYHTRALSPGAGCQGEKGWVFNRSPSALPAPDFTNRNLNLDSWARGNGGVPASGYYVALTLQPVQQRTVVIDNLEVRVVHQAQPTVGTHAFFGQCGGLVP